MADIDDIIDYMKSLRKGFDKDLFQSKINELAYGVDTVGLDYDDFHTMFKVWLNLYLPAKKWTLLGACLVPQERVEERTVEYALRWLLTNFYNSNTFSRICFVLDWLTAAMESDCIDMTALDIGYKVFYTMLSYEVLAPHALKLVFTLTKPTDVTRRRVLELLEHARTRESKKSMYRQIQVLLGLFKSYKPEVVPENVPAISIHTAFKKLDSDLLQRFQKSQERRNCLQHQKQYLTWTNPINSERGKNKKVEPLVPNIEFINIGSKQYAREDKQKNYLDFSDPVSLLHHSLYNKMCRPAHLRALLCNETGLIMLAIASHEEQAFISHDIHQILTMCFLYASPYSYIEKQDFLHRLAVLQNTLLEGIPIITRFLAQYIPFWNEKDFFAEILELVEWVNMDCVDYVASIVDRVTRVYHRAQPMEQCAILKSLTNMYANLVYASKRTRQHFTSTGVSNDNYQLVLPLVAQSISDMCNKELQINPGEMRVLYSAVQSTVKMVRNGSPSTGFVLPGTLTLAFPLVNCSATLLDNMAAILLLYKQRFKEIKSSQQIQKEEYTEKIEILQGYIVDFTNSLYTEEALSNRINGYVFRNMHPQIVGKLCNLMPEIDGQLSLRNHLAFAPYTYLQLQAIDHRDADNKMWFHMVIEQEFVNLSRLLKKTLRDLCYR